MKAMLWMKVKLAAAVLAGAAAVAGGGGVAVHLAAAEQPVEAKKLHPQLVNMAPNTWVKLKPAREPVGRSYSGICYGDGKLFYFGGGHGSYPCNDVELYDVAANTWTQATEPENFNDCDKWNLYTPEQCKSIKDVISGGSTHWLTTPKGRPLVHHTYQMHVWHPEEKVFYNLYRPVLWTFDPAKREWQQPRESGSPGLRDIHTWALTYDPELKAVVYIVVAGDKGVYLYDKAKNAWQRKCDVPLSGQWTEVQTAYDSTRKLHVVHAGDPKKDKGTWWTLDLATGQTKFLAELDVARKALGRGERYCGDSLSMTYDPEARRTVAIVSDKGKAPLEVWAHDAEKDAWSEVKLAGTAPTGINWWQLMAYDPEHKCHLYLNVPGVNGDKTDGVFAFRLKK